MSQVGWYSGLFGASGCGCCDDCSESSLAFVTDKVSASRSKCGFFEFSGHASTPPKRYRKKTTTVTEDEATGIDCSGAGGYNTQTSYSSRNGTTTRIEQYTVEENGSCSFESSCFGQIDFSHSDELIARTSGGEHDMEPAYRSMDSASGYDDCYGVRHYITQEITGCQFFNWDTETWVNVSNFFCVPFEMGCGNSNQTTIPGGTVTTATTKTVTTDKVVNTSCDEGSPCTGSYELYGKVTVETLEEEYTTEMLISGMSSSMPDFDDDWDDGSPSASFNLSENENDVSASKSKYKGRFQPTPTGCFFVRWIERFTPEGGGEPVDTPKEFTWNGVVPGDYDPEDPETWPETPVYNLDIPAADGIVTVVDVESTCDCAGFADEEEE